MFLSPLQSLARMIIGFFFARHSESSHAHRRARKARLCLEALEDRLAPVVYTVTTTMDAGAGSLRVAIQQSNATPMVLDTIAFNIGAGGLQTIAPTAALPTIIDPVIIDGYSQPGMGTDPRIVLDGQNAGAGVTGLTITAGGSTVSGLQIINFSGDGISLQTEGRNQIVSNFIGTDGTNARGNRNGIVVTSSRNGIGDSNGRNVISGNRVDGISIYGNGELNNVELNYIGTDKTGQNAVSNGWNGVSLGNKRGKSTVQLNVISGNGLHGVFVDKSDTNLIEANKIGTNADGTKALGNIRDGISITALGYEV